MLERGQRGREGLIVGGFSWWVREFEAEARRRSEVGDPDFTQSARLHPAVVKSVQRFQVGEAGDGANLIAKAAAAGDGDYKKVVRLFVGEEQNHARLLELLLTSAGAPTIASHWSDVVFVKLRRALGLRLELMVLLIAEVVALRYYRALRDGTRDPLTTEVAGRILADEQRHVPFHCDRLRDAFAGWPRPAKAATTAIWWLLLCGAVVTVAWDHGPALRHLGVTRRGFAVDVAGLFRTALTGVRAGQDRRNSLLPSHTSGS
ncbi:ferritin-like domain-containing protein [Saccharothrix sp. NRRL B-16314]|uniref:ferritin-like domain-containing protein n=1 Tax=Saccharothrix sp. NRRL B-16314 TaxID=1463825 RepID=UPI00068A7ADC|nr:ferritin-like domain-containing protein [Saccharothrix sp. NRRL B-16314]